MDNDTWSLGADYFVVWKTQHEIKPDLTLLDAEEQTRLHRLLTPQKRLEFVSGRTLLKNILADYLRIKPHTITLALTATGKPYLAAQAKSPPPFFNLSHTTGHYLVGVSKYPIGVDIECERPVVMLNHMQHFLHQNELTSLQKVPENEQKACFFSLFTAKEALLKATDKRWRLDEILFQLVNGQWYLSSPQIPCQFYHPKVEGCSTTVCLDRSSSTH